MNQVTKEKAYGLLTEEEQSQFCLDAKKRGMYEIYSGTGTPINGHWAETNGTMPFLHSSTYRLKMVEGEIYYVENVKSYIFQYKENDDGYLAYSEKFLDLNCTLGDDSEELLISNNLIDILRPATASEIEKFNKAFEPEEKPSVDNGRVLDFSPDDEETFDKITESATSIAPKKKPVFIVKDGNRILLFTSPLSDSEVESIYDGLPPETFSSFISTEAFESEEPKPKKKPKNKLKRKHKKLKKAYKALGKANHDMSSRIVREQIGYDGWHLWQEYCGRPKPKEGTYKNLEYYSASRDKWISCSWGVKAGYFYRYKKVKK